MSGADVNGVCDDAKAVADSVGSFPVFLCVPFVVRAGKSGIETNKPIQLR